MPFVSRLQTLRPVENKMLLNWEFGDSFDHGSVGTWIINQDGSVTIPEAAILTSAEDITDGSMMTSIWLTHEVQEEPNPQFNPGGAQRRRQRTVDLKKWCREFLPLSANYAVELGRCHQSSRGLLLKAVRPGSSTLYKVGNYCTPFSQLVVSRLVASTPSQDVD